MIFCGGIKKTHNVFPPRSPNLKGLCSNSTKARSASVTSIGYYLRAGRAAARFDAPLDANLDKVQVRFSFEGFD